MKAEQKFKLVKWNKQLISVATGILVISQLGGAVPVFAQEEKSTEIPNSQLETFSEVPLTDSSTDETTIPEKPAEVDEEDGQVAGEQPEVVEGAGGQVVAFSDETIEYQDGTLKYRIATNSQTQKKKATVIGLVGGASLQDGVLKIPAIVTVNSVAVPVVAIGDRAFTVNSNIQKVDLEDARNLQTIGDGAFFECSNLAGTITIPSTVTSIGEFAFNTTSITVLDLEGAARLETIGFSAFSQCIDLAGTITIPPTVTYIGKYAFEGANFSTINSQLKDLSGVDTSAFYMVTSNITVNVDPSTAYIHNNYFAKAKSSGNYRGTATIKSKPLYSSITLADASQTGVFSDEEFEVRVDLGAAYKDVPIPIDDLLSVTGGTLENTSYVTGPENNPDNLTETAQNTIVTVTVKPTDSAKSVTVSVKEGAFTFFGTSNSVAEDAKVVSLPVLRRTYKDSQGLNYIINYEGLTPVSATVGDNRSFSNKDVTIPETVEVDGIALPVVAISDNAFAFNSSIRKVDLSGAGNLETIGASAFWNCSNLTGTIKIPSKVTSIGGNAFNSTRIIGLSLEDATSLETIGGGAFWNCINLAGTIIIPSTVTNIGQFAFAYTNITTIDSQLKDLSGVAIDAFYGVTSNITVNVDPSTAYIHENYFTKAKNSASYLGTATITSNPFSSTIKFTEESQGDVYKGETFQVDVDLGAAAILSAEELENLVTVTNGEITENDYQAFSNNADNLNVPAPNTIITYTIEAGTGNEPVIATLNSGIFTFFETANQVDADATSVTLNVQEKESLLKDHFTFTIPTGHAYNGQNQSIGNVSAATNGVGTFTIEYRQNNEAVTPKNAGTYQVYAVANEGETYKAGTVLLGEYQISTKAVTATINDVTITQGDSLPATTISYDGFVAGEELTDIFFKEPTAKYAVTNSQKPGVTDILIDDEGEQRTGNYTIEFVPGKLTINEKTVTPNPEPEPEPTPEPEPEEDRLPLYRVYNPNNGEHLYTLDQAEAQGLIEKGWQDEGVGWYGGKTTGKAVYRLYNQNSGEHFYTLDAGEYDNVASAGWTKEGVAFYASEDTEIPIYRVFNPNSQDAGSHHYTLSSEENSWLISEGWRAEGTAFYGK